MPWTSKREIAADNGMWLTYRRHLEQVLDCQNKDEAQSSSFTAISKILNVLNKSRFAVDATLLTRNWGLHEIF